MSSVEELTKEASEMGRASAVSRLGYAVGCIEAAMPDDACVEKVAQVIRVPKTMIKVAIVLKRASPLLKALGVGAALAGGLPILTGLGRGASRGLEKAVSRIGGPYSDLLGGSSMGEIGGMAPDEMKRVNKLIMRQALRNYQMQGMLENLRFANTRPRGGLFGA